MDLLRESALRNGGIDGAPPQSYEYFNLSPPEELSRIAFRFHDSKLNHGMPLRLLGVSRELRPIFPLLTAALLLFCALCVLLRAFQDIAHPLVCQLRPPIPPLGKRFSVVTFSPV